MASREVQLPHVLLYCAAGLRPHHSLTMMLLFNRFCGTPKVRLPSAQRAQERIAKAIRFLASTSSRKESSV
jgi:hypothetical protein